MRATNPDKKAVPWRKLHVCISTLDRPREQEKRDAKVVKEVMRQIFISLKRLHGMGIVHRDVKPVRSQKAPLPLLGMHHCRFANSAVPKCSAQDTAA